jgi:phosphatidate phosphatase APP1
MLSHKVARLEDKWVQFVNTVWVNKRGYIPKVHPYISYGSTSRIRILARVLLFTSRPKHSVVRRGLRALLTAQVPNVRLKITIDNVCEKVIRTDRGGYLDHYIDAKLEPGWHTIRYEFVDDLLGLELERFQNVFEGKLLVAKDKSGVGLISDIDDTIMISHVPQIALAVWMVLASNPHKRKPVRGMQELYQFLSEKYPDLFTMYVSAAPWNLFPTLSKFVLSNGFPLGGFILRDLGPQDHVIIQSTEKHKLQTLPELFELFPKMKWILIGDDGQTDAKTYRKYALEYPEKILAILIRKMKASERFASAKFAFDLEDDDEVKVPMLYASDGFGLIKSFEEHVLNEQP